MLAWCMLGDSLFNLKCLTFPQHVIAAAAVMLASIIMEVRITVVVVLKSRIDPIRASMPFYLVGNQESSSNGV